MPYSQQYMCQLLREIIHIEKMKKIVEMMKKQLFKNYGKKIMKMIIIIIIQKKNKLYE